MNHADKTREPHIKYIHDEEGVMKLVAAKDIQAGEEMFNEYHHVSQPQRHRPNAQPYCTGNTGHLLIPMRANTNTLPWLAML
jgi:hypothetical protein